MAPSHRLRELFIEQLQLVHAAHKQASEQALANGGTASEPKLKRMLKALAKAHERQAHRLERVFATLNAVPEGRPDRGMQGLADANNGLVARCDARVSRDLAIIAAGQVAAHVFVAHYGSLRSYATQLGNRPSARLLGKTLGEWRDADGDLTQLAKGILRRSSQAGYPGEHAGQAPILTGAAILAAGTIALTLLGPPKPGGLAGWLPRR